MKLIHACSALALTVASIGSAHALTLSPQAVAGNHQFSLPGSYEFTVYKGNTDYYELISTAYSDALVELKNVSGSGNGHAVYTVYADSQSAAGVIGVDNTAALFGKAVTENVDPFFSFVIQAGKQYVLEVKNVVGESLNLNSRISAVSAVPLPGAIWLFGSALLGMFGVKRMKRRNHVAPA